MVHIVGFVFSESKNR